MTRIPVIDTLAQAKKCAAVVLLVVLAGCVETPPAPDELRKQSLPNINLERAWKVSTSSEAVQDDWLKTFNDPQLNALVLEAIANNPDLRVAGARVEQAAQTLVIARAPLKPNVSIYGTGGTKTSGSGDSNSALTGIVLGAAWELDLWGRLRYARNAAAEDYTSVRADLEFARQSLAASTAKAWFTATQLAMQANITEQALTSSTRLASLAGDRERVGVGMDSETAVANATALNIESSLQQIRLSRDQALRALELLIGRYPAAEVAARAEVLALPASPGAGMPLQMLERRPDVIADERRIAAAFNRIGEAKAARLPQLTITANFGTIDSEILQLKEGFENPTGGLGARLLAPIYQGGKLNAQVKIRNLQQKEALAGYAGVALRAISEVENSLAANASLAAQVNLLTRVLSEQTRALDLTQDRYNVGRTDLRAVEQQRLNVQQAQVALINARTDELTARVNLHLALGGSFDQQRFAGP